MPIWQPSKVLARPTYFDRDPVMVASTYSATVAPHGQTARVTYTPPVNRAAFIEILFLFTYKSTAAGAPGLVQATALFTPDGGAGVVVARAQTDSNVIGLASLVQFTSFGYMQGGDTMTILTIDPSTGGTQSFTTTVKGTEFLY